MWEFPPSACEPGDVWGGNGMACGCAGGGSSKKECAECFQEPPDCAEENLERQKSDSKEGF